jgi:hypothetical protein
MFADALQFAIEKPTREGVLTAIIVVFLLVSALIWFVFGKKGK